MKYLLFAVLTLTAVGLFWGCNRLDGKEDTNQSPVVAFVNVPLDSSEFNYAPVVRWTGYDPDGLIQAYQYHDDSTTAAVAAYAAGDAALAAYIAGLSSAVWTTTFATSDTIYLRRSEADSITQHVFMVRAVDDKEAVSSVKVRTYFRTNQPPYAPQVKWAADPDREDTVKGYQLVYSIPDTLFWNDTLTSTWSGISFLWKGSDPDSRDLNIIPLTFSYKLVNDDTQQEFPHPVYDDSNRVTGYETGWSPWTSASQVTFTASMATRLDPAFRLDGHLQILRAGARRRPDRIRYRRRSRLPRRRSTFHRQLLIVDQTQTPQLTPVAPAWWTTLPSSSSISTNSRRLPDRRAIRQTVYPAPSPSPSSTMGNRCNGLTTKFLRPRTACHTTISASSNGSGSSPTIPPTPRRKTPPSICG